MKLCEWCEKEMDPSNYKRHLRTCIFKNVIEIKKSDVELLKKNRPREPTEAEQITLMELKNFLTDNYNKAMLLYQRIVEENSKDPIEKIK